jgi:hypothetical protein
LISSSLADGVTSCEIGGGRFVTLRELGRDDFAAVMALRSEVISRLPNPDLYVREKNEASFVMSQLGESSLCYGIETDARLIGYTVLTMDIEGADLEPEFGRAIVDRAAAVREPLQQWGLFAVTMVHPDFRSQRLHDLAIDTRLAAARAHGKRRLMAMVPTTNVPSLCNLTRKGFQIDGVLDFADGRVRFLLSRALVPEACMEPGEVFDEIPLNDIAEHRRLIADQFTGSEVVVRGEQAFLRWARRPRAS